MKKPTVSQYVLLRRMLGAGPVFRMAGGFWTVPGVAIEEKPGSGQVPRWYASTQTVMSAEKAGLVARSMRWPEAWRDERVLTPAGEAEARLTWTGRLTDSMRSGLLSFARGSGGDYYAEELATLGYLERQGDRWVLTGAGKVAMTR